ncbi:unnamed protein product [Amaranthus hypochondriacus]
MASSSQTLHLHIGVFPFMSKGHTIPLLDLIKLIHKHRPNATFTIFTTPSNQSFISSYLLHLPLDRFSIISLCFQASNDILDGIENTDQLPSMSLFPSFALSTINLQPHFEKALENLKNPISFLIHDGFLYWTKESTSKFNIIRLAFYGMNMYTSTITRVVYENKIFSMVKCEDELVQVPKFPWIKVRKDEFESPFNGNEILDEHNDFIMKCVRSTSMSYCMLVNSFYELEQPFVDYSNSRSQYMYWCVGPFCLVEKPKLDIANKSDWVEWLDKKWDEGKRVLYVAFGSQVEISSEQLKEIGIGLENSGVDFLWVLRIKPNQDVCDEIKERVKEKGLLVTKWVDQRLILEHKSVQGFLSHCGWNSTIESICAGVPILAWPMIAEQPLNARMVVEEIKVGLRVETCNGLVKGFVKWEILSKMVKELMEGEKGKIVRERVKEFSEAAKKAIEEGGSSWSNLETLLKNLETMKATIVPN